MEAKNGSQLYQSTRILVVLTLLSICIEVSHADPAYDSSGIYDEVGLSTSEVLRLRGYNAVDHTVITQDGYALNLVEACNPLINYTDNSDLANKEVVLFFHGILWNATCYITDTPKPAGPHDFSRLNASQMSVQQIYDLYDGSPNVESLVFLLLDYGHRVFLANARSTLASQRAYAEYYNMPYPKDLPGSPATAAALYNNLTSAALPGSPFSDYLQSLASTVDAKYWNFSIDEEAAYDLPATVNRTLDLTNSCTLAVVGWSKGGAIIEMGLATQPILNQQITKSLLWSPSLYLGRSVRDRTFAVLLPLLTAYVGPLPPEFLADILAHLGVELCRTEAVQDTVCEAVVYLFGGFGGNMQLLKPGFFNSAPAPVSSHEFAQLFQSAIYGKMHRYTNDILIVPPLYDVSKITSKGLYFWGAEYDGLVNIEDVAENVADLSVPAVFTRLDQPGIFFEHVSYLWHKNKSELLYIPSLRILESN